MGRCSLRISCRFQYRRHLCQQWIWRPACWSSWHIPIDFLLNTLPFLFLLILPASALTSHLHPYWYSLLLLTKMRWKVNLELLLKGIQVIPGLCDQLQEVGLWQATSGILKVSTHYFPEHRFSPVMVLILQQQWWASIWIQHTLPF